MVTQASHYYYNQQNIEIFYPSHEKRKRYFLHNEMIIHALFCIALYGCLERDKLLLLIWTTFGKERIDTYTKRKTLIGRQLLLPFLLTCSYCYHTT